MPELSSGAAKTIAVIVLLGVILVAVLVLAGLGSTATPAVITVAPLVVR